MAPESGGPPVVVSGLTAALARRGHCVSIACVHDARKAEPAHVVISPDVALHTFPLDGSPAYSSSTRLDQWLRTNTHQFDILHLHGVWQFPTFAAARACWKRGVPYLSLPHGMLDQYSVDQRSAFRKRIYWNMRERAIQARASAVHCLNRAEVRRAVSWIEHFPKVVIGNGISNAELADLPPRGEFRREHPDIAQRPIALFLSRLHPKKGLERLIPAWRPLADRRPDIALLIAGSGQKEYEELLDKLITQHGLQKQVIRVGQLNGRKRWEALVDADVFVLPSHQEGFSMAITEAMAASCPVVVTEECNFDEIEETPPGASGVIIKGGDMNTFVDAVDKMFADPAARRRMGMNGAGLVRERFTWEKVAADLEKVYRHVLAGKALAPDGSDVWR
jgi:glycosyltransferase involved in cell wall biosynthesis